MVASPLNLIATAVPVLNTLGLRVRVGLSSDDPIVGRHQAQRYRAYATVYAPDGRFLERTALGAIEPNRRRMVDLSALTARHTTREDHLVVVHRVPEALFAAGLQERALDEPMELGREHDYTFFRTYLEYAWRDWPGGHGSVIYEIPPVMNEPREGKPPSNTLTFTTKMWLSERVETSIVLANCSTDPRYRQTSVYGYGFHAPDGEPVAAGRVSIPPFAVRVLHARAVIPPEAQQRLTDPVDGAAICSFIGYCEGAGTVVLILNVDRHGGGVSVEHTHPAQAYLMPSGAGDANRLRNCLKAEAVAAWKARLNPERISA